MSDQKLLDAAKHGEVDKVRQYLDKGASVNTKNANGWTLLHWAARGGHPETVRLLLEKGAVVDPKNASGSTPLHLASHNGRVETAYLLLDAGADMLTENSGGRTPLNVADSQHMEAAMRMHEVMGSTKEKLEAIVKKQNPEENAEMVLETVAQIAVFHEMHDKRLEDIQHLKQAKAGCETLVETQKSLVTSLKEKANRADEVNAAIASYKEQAKQYQAYVAALAKRTKECAKECENNEKAYAEQEQERKEQDAKLIAKMTFLRKKLANYEMREDTVNKTIDTIDLVLDGLVE